MFFSIPTDQQNYFSIGPYQIWANVSDLHVSWSKVAVGLIIHKNDKKIEWIVVWHLYERFHGNKPKIRKMQDLNNQKR